MTNAEIKELQAAVSNGQLLNQAQQLFLLQQLFRANRRILAAKAAGFNVEPSRSSAAEDVSPPDV